MKVLAIGASRNIGYFAALSLLRAGNTVTFQLRNVSAFDEDVEIQPFVKSGQAKLVKGDALVQEDVRTAWTEANADGVPVDVVLLSVGKSAQLSNSEKFLSFNPPVYYALQAEHQNSPSPKASLSTLQTSARAPSSTFSPLSHTTFQLNQRLSR